MKKIIGILASLILLFGVSYGDNIDYLYNLLKPYIEQPAQRVILQNKISDLSAKTTNPYLKNILDTLYVKILFVTMIQNTLTVEPIRLSPNEYTTYEPVDTHDTEIFTYTMDGGIRNKHIINYDRSKCIYTGETATSMLQLVNSKRSATSTSQLVMDTCLNFLAQKKAEDMIARSYFSHYDPQGKTIRNLADQYAYLPRTIGENLFRKGLDFSPEAAMEALMASTGHRNNILNSIYTKVGFGKADPYWVQVFSN